MEYQYKYGLSGEMRELVSGFLLDPIDLGAAYFPKGIGKAADIAGATDVSAALKQTRGLAEAAQYYGILKRTTATTEEIANLPRIARQAGHATIIEVNAEPTPLTEEGISDYLIQGKTGEILPMIVEEIKEIKQVGYLGVTEAKPLQSLEPPERH